MRWRYIFFPWLRTVDALAARLEQALREVSLMRLEEARAEAESHLRGLDFQVMPPADDERSPDSLHQTLVEFFRVHGRVEHRAYEFVLDCNLFAPSLIWPEAVAIGHGGSGVEYAATSTGEILESDLELPEGEALLQRHGSIFHLIVYVGRTAALT